jgi:hypothetical protein
VDVAYDQGIDVAFPNGSKFNTTRWPGNIGDFGLPVAVYEIFPNDEEAVLTVVNGLFVDRVLERVPITIETTMTGTIAHPTARATFNRRVHMSMTAPGQFTCHDEVPIDTAFNKTSSVASVAIACRIDADCPVGTLCTDVNKGCLGFCSATCDPTQTFCVMRELERRCSSVLITIAPVLASSPTYQAVAGFIPAAPDQTVFTPLQQGFIVSFPGARGLGEIKSDPLAGFIPAQYR